MSTNHSGTVVTYEAGDGSRYQVQICTECERRMLEEGVWPRGADGAEVINVRLGAHYGTCEILDADMERMRARKSTIPRKLRPHPGLGGKSK